MEDHRFPFQDDFEKRLATLRLRADDAGSASRRPAGGRRTLAGGDVPGISRKELEAGFLEDPGIT